MATKKLTYLGDENASRKRSAEDSTGGPAKKLKTNHCTKFPESDKKEEESPPAMNIRESMAEDILPSPNFGPGAKVEHSSNNKANKPPQHNNDGGPVRFKLPQYKGDPSDQKKSSTSGCPLKLPVFTGEISDDETNEKEKERRKKIIQKDVLIEISDYDSDDDGDYEGKVLPHRKWTRNLKKLLKTQHTWDPSKIFGTLERCNL
eukprot:UN31364